MSRPNPLILIGILALFGGVLGWLTYSTGIYFLSEHEGDTMHLLDIVFRMHDGALPHLDFETPIGILAFLPITYLMDIGYSVGQSILYSQILVMLCLAPFILYVAWSRLSAPAGYAFAALSTTLILAISYGGTGAGTSMSMHYNRWAWVVSALAILLTLLPGRGRTAVFDGVLVGVLFSLLALIKVTFFMMILPGTMAALLLQGRRLEFYMILATGLMVFLAVAAVLGVGFWQAYAENLITVSGSEVRPHTGLPLTHIVAGPAFLPFTALGFLAYHFLNRAGLRPQALGMIILLPGFLFITWQNFGNDPVWLVPLLAIVLTYAAQEDEIGTTHASRLTILSVLAAMFILPWGLTLAMSPLRHASQDMEAYERVLPDIRPEANDIFVRRDRGYSMLAQTFFDDPGDPWDANADLLDRKAPREIGGIAFPHCEFMAGSVNWFRQLAADLESIGVPESSQLFTTDILGAFWLHGPYEPLKNGAPWYYANLSGIENADYLIVPKCGFAERVRQIIIQDVIDAEIEVDLVGQTERVAVFALP